MNNEVSHEDLITTNNEQRNYRELKESIRMMNSHRRDTENIKLIEESKKKKTLMDLLNAMNLLITV